MSHSAEPWAAIAVFAVSLGELSVVSPPTAGSAGAVASHVQQAQSADALYLLIDNGFKLLEQKRLTEARAAFERAIEQARAAGRRANEVAALRGLGRTLREQGEYAAARASFVDSARIADAIGDHRAAGDAYNDLGLLAWTLGDDRDVQTFFSRAVEAFDLAGERQDRARSLRNLTFATGLSPEERVRLLEEARRIALDLGDRVLEGQVLHQTGDVLFGVGSYAASIEKLDRAVALLEQAGDRHSLARALTSLGRTFRAHGRPQRAIEIYTRVLDIQREVGDKTGLSQTHSVLARAYFELGQQQESIGHREQQLALARASGSPRAIAFALGALGAEHAAAGNYQRAIDLLEQRLPNAAPEDLLVWNASLALSYEGLGRYDDAMRAATAAELAARQQDNAERLAQALQLRARVYEETNRLPEALADARAALQVIERLRTQLVPSDYLKRGFSELHQAAFSFAIRMLSSLGQHQEALEAAERARARAFLDLLASRESEACASATDADAMRGSSTSCHDAVVLTRGELSGRASTANREYELDLASQASAGTPSAAKIGATAARLKSVVLNYWVTETATYVWVVSSGRPVHARRIVVPESRLEHLVHQTWAPVAERTHAATSRQRVRAGGGTRADVPIRLRGGSRVLPVPLDRAESPYRALYDLLIGPIAENLPAADGALLTIVPHGPLFRLSFAALLDPRGRYLIERYSLHYASAAGMLEFTQRTKERLVDHPMRYLLVADPAPFPAGQGAARLVPLPGARKEVAAIARLLPPDRVIALTGRRAAEERVVPLAATRTVLHFATHGVVSDSSSLESFLAFARSGGGPSSDGRLTAREIYDLRLGADLVVLSACRSAAGEISGDGIIGLTRPFFYAGTASVLATLSDVADEAASYLLPRFYRTWQRMGDKALALRSAQMSLLHALRAGQIKVSAAGTEFVAPEHPVLWGSFVLIGEP